MGDTKGGATKAPRKRGKPAAPAATTAPREARSERELTTAIAAEIRDSILPGDGPFAPGWVEDAAAMLCDTAKARQPGEPAVSIVTTNEGVGDGGEHARRLLRLAVINDDMPFLVDSVAATVSSLGIVVDRLVHPVVDVRRDADGGLAAITAKPGEGSSRESMIYIETARVEARQRRALEAALLTTLADVRAAVSDWPRMVALLREDAAREIDAESAALLEWFAGGMLTQLGHITRRRDGSHAQVLGICRRASKALLSDASYELAFAWFEAAAGRKAAPRPLIVKANRIATVHRRIPLDLFLVPVIEGGKVAAISVHAGIWTSAALNTPPEAVPVLRRQLAGLSAKLGFDPKGHTGKALAHALTSLPHDLLVSVGEEDAERLATTVTSLVDRPRPRLLLIKAPLARHLHAFVWMPRDMLASEVHDEISQMLEQASGGKSLDWSLQIEAGTLAMLRYVIDIREGRVPDEADLDARLQVMLRGWGEAVEAALATDGETARAAAIAARYADAFPVAYRNAYGAQEAAIDIRHLRRLAGPEGEADATAAGDGFASERRDVRLLAWPRSGSEQQLRLKLYQRSGMIALSDAVPALENFGFRVIEDLPTMLPAGRDGALGAFHDFAVALPVGRALRDVLALAPMIEGAIAGVLNASGEDDAFNRLIPGLGLSPREANWLRAWYRYLRQTGLNYGITTAVDALQAAPDVTLGLIDLFRAIHDPSFPGDRSATAETAQEGIRAALAGVQAINDDRLLRAFRALVGAILRTNAFAPAGEVALAFKFDSGQVPGLPKPVPWREIFVYSRRVEGIHLRAGPIARGGLRWSDRRDDFRTEILGLMKAQRVKNAVIVPTGAKGGFYPKLLPDPQRDRAGWAAEGQASYEVFVRTLLSITDNLVGEKVVHPEGVRTLDGDDPYFVVAADKGTARFSDVANAIAQGEDFWLDDAFASGGSNGYDHKAMGITARGGWISVQRHFLELGVDVQTEPVRVAGVGDMSGDVFGNGMLLSKAVRLVAAFDHRHVFLDPSPDAERAWEERARLFALPTSSWDDYDKALISKGGGVFPRNMKAIPLSEEVRAMLGLTASEIDPDSLISAILRAQVDLIWFGGIGTYIKAAAENNAVVGDPANDAVRVNADEVQARVIGEGANLGVTQAGRIAFAMHGAGGRGGRINTDFIDNSAGVDCSDNEVNIKIALAAARRSGKLSEKQRIALLREMTDEVAQLVLDDNRHQALALSIAERGGAEALPSLVRLIETLEESGALDRRTEGLADSETLGRRALDGRGLTRPELAVLLSSGKLVLQSEIEQSAVPDDESLEPLLLASFPSAMRERFSGVIRRHRLRREIIATKLANRIVNRLGIVHPFELAEEEGASLAHVAAAFALADQLFGLDALWERLDGAEMPEEARLTLFENLALAVRSHMAELLRAGAGRVPSAKIANHLSAGIAELERDTAELLGDASRQHSERLLAGLVARRSPQAEALAVVHLFDLDGAVGIADLAADAGLAPRALVDAFSDLGARLGLDWAQSAAAVMSPSDPWERLLVAGLARDFQQMRLDFLRRLAKKRKADPLGSVAIWAGKQEVAIRAFRAMVARAEAKAPVAPAVLAQIASQARNLLAR